MRSPRGFGRRYFTLASIQAHGAEPLLHARICALEALHVTLMLTPKEVCDEDDPPETAGILCIQKSKPCHCNCFFKHLTRLILLFSRHLFFQACNCRFYSFRRSGVHPPFLSFS